MERSSLVYKTCVEVLERELLPALGCTEPIAVAFCAAKAREVLGLTPQRVVVEASGNIIKNVKSVVVPNTGGKKGMEAAAAIGIVAGDASRNLEVIAAVGSEDHERLSQYLQEVPIEVKPYHSGLALDICVSVFADGESARVRVSGHHTGVVLIEHNGQKLWQEDAVMPVPEQTVDYSLLTVENILDFAKSLAIEDVEEILSRQIEYNLAIAEEGLKNDYGANIGKVLLQNSGEGLRGRARAKAAAGSDARMNGCVLPVIINSGSGNQGITVSVPVIEYHRALGLPKEKLYRALTISNLIALHLKDGIGRLSAYCGAVSAGVSAGAAIAYLQGGDMEEIAHTLVNSLAIASGMVCDGAKASCAAKIAVAVDAGLLGYEMYQAGQQFYGGDGLVLKGVENTIRNFGILAREGMRETDIKIIELMTE